MQDRGEALQPPIQHNHRRATLKRGEKPPKPVDKRGSILPLRPLDLPPADLSDQVSHDGQEQGSCEQSGDSAADSAGDKIVIDMADGMSILFTVPTGVFSNQIVYVNDRGLVVPEPCQDGKQGPDDANRMITVDVKIPEYVYGDTPITSLNVAHPHGGEVVINIPPGSKSGETLHVQVPSRRTSVPASSRKNTRRGSALTGALSSDNEYVILSTEWKHPMETDMKVTDTHVKTKLTSHMCCCCCRFPFNETFVVELDSINGVSTTQPKDAGTCALVTLYTVWLFFGPLG